MIATTNKLERWIERNENEWKTENLESTKLMVHVRINL